MNHRLTDFLQGRRLTKEEATMLKQEIDLRTYEPEADSQLIQALENWLHSGETDVFEWWRGAKVYKVYRWAGGGP